MAAQAHIGINPTTFNAAVDFSACPTTLYRGVRAGSVAGEVALANGASNPQVLGVMQDTASAGGQSSVILLGPTKIAARVSGCNLVFGRYLVCASDGFFEAASSTGCLVSAMWLSGTVTTVGTSAIGSAQFFGLTSSCAAAIA
jgi:hypothetical protein